MATHEMDAAAIRQHKIRRRKIMSLLVGVVVIAVLAGIIVDKAKHKKSDNTGITLGQATITTISQKISATGSVTAQTGAEVKIGSQVTGRIKQLDADVGSHVRAGQIIAELDLPDVRAQLVQAQANLSSAQLKLQEQLSGVSLQHTTTASGITQAKASLASAKATYNQAVATANLQISAAQAAVKQAQASAKNARALATRESQLLSKGYIAAQDVETAQSQADVADAQLDSAQQNLNVVKAKTATDVETARSAVNNAAAGLSSANAGTAQNTIKGQQVAEARSAVIQARAQVAVAQAQFDKTIIKTPISGTIVTLDAQQGETIAAGLSAPTLVQVVALDRLQVDAYVDETDIGNVHVGQEATVSVDAYPNRKFRGHVTKVASVATMQQNVVTYDTTVALDNPGGLLKPDMTATVELVVGQRDNVVAVPIEAVKSGKKGQIVYVVTKPGVDPTPRRVMTGISDDTMTEITRGLKGDETVVLAGYPKVDFMGNNKQGGSRGTPSPLGMGGGGGRRGMR